METPEDQPSGQIIQRHSKEAHHLSKTNIFAVENMGNKMRTQMGPLVLIEEKGLVLEGWVPSKIEVSWVLGIYTIHIKSTNLN